MATPQYPPSPPPPPTASSYPAPPGSYQPPQPGYMAPGPQPGWAPPPAPPTKKSNTIWIVFAAVAIVVLIIIVAALASHPTSPASNPNSGPPATSTIVPSGTVWQIPAGHYEYTGFSLPWTATVNGGFTATGSGVDVFIITPSEYQNYSASSSNTPSSYVWTSGPGVTSGTISTGSIAAGTWYIIFLNQQTFSSTSVQVTSALVGTEVHPP